MHRISTNLTNDDMQFWARRREYDLNRVQNQMSQQTRIQNLRDDPLAASHSTRFQSYTTRLERFSENIEYTRDNYEVTEGYMRQATDIMQRVRELAVQGANGSYNTEDRRKMATEVNELLNELVQLANARNGSGETIFSGTKSKTEPFRAVHGDVEGASGQVITNVDYIGNIERNRAEVAEGSFIEMNFPGNEVFWAENQQVFSTTDATGYQVQEDSTIRVDGVEIELSQGDNIHAVISKINNSKAAVEARLDPVQSSLVLESTSPHQLWLEDAGEGTVLQDLGVLADGDNPPPQNIAASADVFGGSVFDVVMNLRDRLYEGDTLDIGGSALRGIDDGLENMLSNVASLGAKDTRLETVYERTEDEIPKMKEMNSKEVDLDLTRAVTDLRMLEHTHQAAIGTAGRILQQTLLDFLR
ncbi:MAG: flagellar hook-associated protein 3 [Spirochaetaceae bacterium]